MTTVYFEYCRTIADRIANMKPAEFFDTLKDGGFRSVYGFSEETAHHIVMTSESRGFKRFEVYADTLFMDFDNQKEAAEKTIKTLRKLGVKFDVYTSGGRSVHLHIPHKPMWSKHLPHTHNVVASKISDKFDPTLYRHNSIFRLDCSVHSKSGNVKKLIRSFDGRLLTFSIVEKEEFDSSVISDGNIPFDYLLNRMLTNMTIVSEGNRHNTLFSLGLDLIDYGFSDETCLELLQAINSNFQDPKPESEVVRAFKGSCDYRR